MNRPRAPWAACLVLAAGAALLTVPAHCARPLVGQQVVISNDAESTMQGSGASSFLPARPLVLLQAAPAADAEAPHPRGVASSLQLSATASSATKAVEPMLFVSLGLLVGVPLLAILVYLLMLRPEPVLKEIRYDLAVSAGAPVSSSSRLPPPAPESRPVDQTPRQESSTRLYDHQDASLNLYQCEDSSSAASDNSAFLCAALVVDVVGGVTLLIEGELEPYQQESTLNITKSGAKGGSIFHAVMSESGKDAGILLESAHDAHIAFLDTSCAVAPQGSQVLDSRRVAIHKAYRKTFSTHNPPFADVVPEGSAGRYTARRHGVAEPLLQVFAYGEPGRDSKHAANVLGPQGQLLAATKFLESGKKGGPPRLQLDIKYGADAGLILCMVMAVQKLSQV